MNQLNPKIILIISTGHSGSTLLDLIAGTLPGVMSTGELIWLPWQTWRDGKKCTATPKQDICTCLKTFKECPAWSRVLKNISGETGKDITNDPLSYDTSFLRNKKYTKKKYYRLRILRKLLIYAIINNQDFLIDRILLYKDARSYAASGKHWSSKVSVEKRLKNWFGKYQNHYIPILKKMKAETLTVKYDDIAQQPDKMRKNVAQFIGSTCKDEDWKIDSKRMHIVAGNPMRFQGNIHVKYDDRWRQELTLEEKKLAEDYEKRMELLMSIFQG